MNKEYLINEYMKNVDLSDPDKISIRQIKMDLKRILQEEPSVELEYNVEYKLNEVNKQEEKIENLAKLKIYFTNINTSGGLDEGGIVEFIL